MKLAKAAEMRRMEKRAIDEFGIAGEVLMENAGAATVEAILRWRGQLSGHKVAVVLGPGNNGGDGLVIARLLQQAGCQVVLYALLSPSLWVGDAATHWHRVEQMPVRVVVVTEEADVSVCQRGFLEADFLVDALFGTGLSRRLEGRYAAVIDLMNRSGRPIVAVDMPSGLDSDSGRLLGPCVRAELTVTFALAKPGQVVLPGAEYVGCLSVADIGIPAVVVEEAGLMIELLSPVELARLLPPRLQGSHKGTFGHLLVLAGSQGKTGAAVLAALGALRSGVGLVSLGVPKRLNAIIETSLLEAMTVPLASDYFLGDDDYAALTDAMPGKDALLLGPGMGLDPETASLVNRLYREVCLPMVVDADALTLLGQSLPADIGTADRVLTPHPGEMARLTGLTTAEIQQNRLEVARAYAEEKGVVLLLKGAATIIAAPDGRLAVNPTGNPGMATGGMGDVLSGVIGALLAEGVAAWEAACLGAFAHGLAADRLARSMTRGGFLASEVAAELPAAFQEIALGE
ncbi:MAG: NAD(P)H-hydrate dehydratase [Desulfobulbaceae bacterium]|nr:NAD(P)H-hydrate dehydratase [Desulfobulbaceae bacterium]